MTTKLTEMEATLLKEIPFNNFYEEGFESILWTSVLLDDSSIPLNKARAVIVNLGKKGYVNVDGGKEGTTTLTELGREYLLNSDLDLNEKGYKTVRVTLVTFTGMLIGRYAIAETYFNEETRKLASKIVTKKGEMHFDRATGVQIGAKNPKFANRILF